MTVKTLKRQSTPSKDATVYFSDPEFQTGGITIDQDAYTAGLDRVYDVRGLKNMNITVRNTGGANGLTYTIEGSRKNFVNVSTLIDADFDNIIKADTNVAFGAFDTNNIVDISPETSSIRLRVKRQITVLDTTLAGEAQAN